MNALANMKQNMAEFKTLDAKDKKSRVADLLLNNAIYILLVIFVIYTATQNKNFLTVNSLVNIVSLAASSLPIALRNYGTFVPFHLLKIYLEAVPCEKPYFCEMNGG